MSDEKKDVTDESAEEEKSSEETSEESEEQAVSEGTDSDASEEAAEEAEEEADEEAEEEAAEEAEEEADEEAEEEADEEAEEEADAEAEKEADDEAEEDSGHGGGDDHDHGHGDGGGHDDVLGLAAFFDHPDHLVYAASEARDADFEVFDAYSPFPIHGMDDAMGLGRSWIPWVTFFAGVTGFATACLLEFGIMTYLWPMVFGGKPFNAWPSFVPVLFELTVLFAGHTTAFVMLFASGCFRKPMIIDPEITNDRFVLWISADDSRFDRDNVVEFMRGLNPMEIRTVRKEAH